MITLAEIAKIEQKTLKKSLMAITIVALGSLLYGIYIKSEVVILNGIFSSLSLISSYLSFLTAKLIARPADKKFQYGYWHIEPLMHCLSGLMLLATCSYAFFNGIVLILQGGGYTDGVGIIWFSVITGLISLSMWFYQRNILKKIESQLIENDSKEWISDFGFSLITFIGFIILPFLDEPYYSLWARYADSAMVVVMALIVFPIPIRILNKNLREVLLITDSKEKLNYIIKNIMQEIKKDYDLKSYSSHVVKSGRSYFIEINMVVPDDFKYQNIHEQDKLREKIWTKINENYTLYEESSWFSVCITAQDRWS